MTGKPLLSLVFSIPESTMVTLPLYKVRPGNKTVVDIDWGDKSPIESVEIEYRTSLVMHDYSQPGIWTVRITENKDHVEELAFGNEMSSWFGAEYLVGTSDYISPRFTSLSGMFNGAHVFNNPNISSWDMSNVTHTSHMFQDAYCFNQPIGNWNVSNVTTMLYMFNNARFFNQDIENWNVGKVTDLTSMFSGAESFNQKLDAWKVQDASAMFDFFSDEEENLISPK